MKGWQEFKAMVEAAVDQKPSPFVDFSTGHDKRLYAQMKHDLQNGSTAELITKGERKYNGINE